MKNIAIKLYKRIYPEYGDYSQITWKNKLNTIFQFKKHYNHKYLFILSPPYCGSTLLNELISTSKYVSVNNPWGTREGQTLPTVRHIMFDHGNRWDDRLDYDWQFIKKEWRKYWDLHSPILLEKSPPSIIRAISIEENFDPAYFIVFHRNPYAHCESLMRRNKCDARTAAIFAMKCLSYQKENSVNLKTKVTLSYEELTENTSDTVEMILNFLPELIDIKHDQNFSAHNYLGKKMIIENLNNDKIGKLTDVQIDDINDIFNDNLEILNYFNYKLIH